MTNAYFAGWTVGAMANVAALAATDPEAPVEAVQFGILMACRNADNPVSVRNAAKQLGIDQAKVREAMRKLREVGLVRTTQDPLRGEIIRLTDLGKQFFAETNALFSRFGMMPEQEDSRKAA